MSIKSAIPISATGTPVDTPARPLPEDAGSLWTSRRRYIAIFLFFNLCINYMDRTALSIAGPAIAKQFQWRPGAMGLLFSSFMWTYSLCLIPWGVLTDRFGTRVVSSISVTLWSAAAMLTSLSTGFGTMLSTRLALGIGESASLPMAAKVVRQWFPANERGLATAIFNTGTFAGPAFAAPLVAWLVLNTSWRMSFVITGGTGLIWVALWLKFFKLPSGCEWLADAERHYLVSAIEVANPRVDSVRRTILDLVSHRTMWGLCLTQGCCAYTMSVFLFWLPLYLTTARNMSLMKASWFTSLPYVIASVLGIWIGRVSDTLLTSESARQGNRRAMVIFSMAVSMVVVLITAVKNDVVALVLISIALSFISGSLSLNIALTNDLVWDSQVAGTALGILILGGISFSLMAPIVTGYIVQATGSFTYAFGFAGVLLVVGILSCFWMTRRPLTFPGRGRA